MIRNSLKLLNELSELENQISDLEKYLAENCPELDLAELLERSLEMRSKS